MIPRKIPFLSRLSFHIVSVARINYSNLTRLNAKASGKRVSQRHLANQPRTTIVAKGRSHPILNVKMPRKQKHDEYEEEEDLDDLEVDAPPTVEPYAVLGIEKTATEDEVKSSYRKAALKNHPGMCINSSSSQMGFRMSHRLLQSTSGARCDPDLQKKLLTLQSDKAPPHLKDEATTKFQEIAFAYAILSDPVRRKRYDITGSTAETLSADGDFSWAEFYSEQFRDVVTSDAIENFAKSYKGSDEEKDSVLAAYEAGKGKWGRIYEKVMLSNPLEDEERFRGYIDEAVEKGEATVYKAYAEESKSSRKKRMDAARREGTEAEEHAKKIGVYDKLFVKENAAGKKSSTEDSLKALIQGRQAGRQATFLDNLEAKYAGQQKGKGKGKKRDLGDDDEGEPSEEAFQAAAARLKNGKGGGEASGRKKGKKAKH